MGERPTIFVSYCESDVALKDRLVEHFAIFKRQGLLDLWDDTRIRPGAYRSTEIEQAIRRAKIAILIVSPSYLAAEFIVDNELQPLLERRKNEGLHIVPILARPCAWEHIDWLSDLFHPDEKALSARPDFEVDDFLSKLARQALGELKNSSIAWKAAKDPKVLVTFAVAITSTSLMVQWSSVGGIYVFGLVLIIAVMMAALMLTAGSFALQWVNTWALKMKTGSTLPMIGKVFGSVGTGAASSSTVTAVGSVLVVAGSVGTGSGFVASQMSEPVSQIVSAVIQSGPHKRPPSDSNQPRRNESANDDLDAGSVDASASITDASIDITDASIDSRDASPAGDSGASEAWDSQGLCNGGNCLKKRPRYLPTIPNPGF